MTEIQQNAPFLDEPDIVEVAPVNGIMTAVIPPSWTRQSDDLMARLVNRLTLFY